MNPFRQIGAALTLLSALLLCTSCSSMLTREETDDIWLVENYHYAKLNSVDRSVFEEKPHHERCLVLPYVDKIAFDLEYICVQQLEVVDHEVQWRATPAYYVIVVRDSEILIPLTEVLGPMTEEEFDLWYADLGRDELPQWISTKKPAALIARRDEVNSGQTQE